MKKLGAILATILIACALSATPALARGRYGPGYGHWRGGNEWRGYDAYRGYGPNQGYGNGRWGYGYGYGYPYAGYGAYPGRWGGPGWGGWGWHHDDDDGWFNRGGWFHHDD